MPSGTREGQLEQISATLIRVASSHGHSLPLVTGISQPSQGDSIAPTSQTRKLRLRNAPSPVHGWGRGANSPRSKGSLNGHGVILFSQFHILRAGISHQSKITRAISLRLGCQVLGASPFPSLGRAELSGRGRTTPRPLSPPAPARLVQSRWFHTLAGTR